MLLTLQYKIWVKASAEQQFLYGNHVLKSGIGRMTENVEKYQGVVIYSMNDLPLVNMLLLFSQPLPLITAFVIFIQVHISFRTERSFQQHNVFDIP